MNLRNSFSDLHCDHLLANGPKQESLKKNTSLKNIDVAELLQAKQNNDGVKQEAIKDFTGVDRKYFLSTTL